jgi:hypothetical protein
VVEVVQDFLDLSMLVEEQAAVQLERQVQEMQAAVEHHKVL